MWVEEGVQDWISGVQGLGDIDFYTNKVILTNVLNIV